ncbi:MAG: sigma-54-dependent Fis family transcriptional regulator [Planctomycetota bacterium]
MSRVDYRRKAVLGRIGTTLDQFYMKQEIDWDYDVRTIIDQILELALTELEFGEGKPVDRGLIIVPTVSGDLEVGGGWRTDDDLSYSRTVVNRTLQEGRSILYENTQSDTSFENAESLKSIAVQSLICVPIHSESEALGAIYVERRDAGHLFTSADEAFLMEFARTIAPYVKTALIHQKHVAEIQELKVAAEQSATMPRMLGRSDATRKALELARIAAGVEKTVVITGASGSGKELLAQAIHQQSRRMDGPFVVVDCSALSENLLESELFGHKRGSFTGAVTDKPGAFEEASGGTLFLDEICDSSKSLQQKLRRVLQEGQIRRVGENVQREVDVRVVCATNRNLQEEVDEKRFIHDLYHRIHQFPITLPPLRERKEDIPILVEHFIAGSGSTKNPPVRGVSPEALQLLMARDWHANNVRELRNVVELAVDLAGTDIIQQQTIEQTLEIRGEQADTPSEDPLTGALSNPQFDGECLALDTDRTRQLFEETSAEAEKENRPYYRVQREFCGKLGVESLRFTGWKLRPAARLLGVSPVKLRQDFRHYLELLFDLGADRSKVAEILDMPEATLERKLSDLGIDIDTGSQEGAA